MANASLLTVEDVIRVARRSKGARLPTIGNRASFEVDVRPGRYGDVLVFIVPSTGKERKATNRKRLEDVVRLYNRTGSMKIPDYEETDSQCLSYILRLIGLAADQKAELPR